MGGCFWNVSFEPGALTTFGMTQDISFSCPNKSQKNPCKMRMLAPFFTNPSPPKKQTQRIPIPKKTSKRTTVWCNGPSIDGTLYTNQRVAIFLGSKSLKPWTSLAAKRIRHDFRCGDSGCYRFHRQIGLCASEWKTESFRLSSYGHFKGIPNGSE